MPIETGRTTTRYTGESISDILKRYETAREETRTANEARYQAAIAEMRTGQGKIGAQFDVARQDVGRGAVRSLASQRQSLISAGLGNTTIQSAIARGTEEDRTRAMANIAGIQGAAESDYSARLAQLIGRETAGPDFAPYSMQTQAARRGMEEAGTVRRYGPAVDRGQSTGGSLSRAGGGGGGARAGGGGSVGGRRSSWPGGGAGGGGGGSAYGAQLSGGDRGAATLAGIMGGATTYFGAGGASGVAGPGAETGLPGGTGYIRGLDTGQGASIDTTGRVTPFSSAAEAKKPETYAEYKKRAGTSAVSPMYWSAVMGGGR